MHWRNRRDRETFIENALEKAIAVAKHTKQVALADDSGLVVDALGGAPGVMSARYAGPGASDSEKYRKLLSAMDDVPDGQRTARFICVVAIATPEGHTWTAEGSVEGAITREPRGSGGFGYDPVFLVPELGLTFAQIDTKPRITCPIVRGLLPGLFQWLKRLWAFDARLALW